MTTHDSGPELGRRRFLGGSAIAAGALLTGSLPTLAASTDSPVGARARTQPRFGPPPGVARLVSNENPYGPSPAALEAMATASAQGGYYARDAKQWLRDMIAEHNDVPSEWVRIGPGSTAVLSWLTVAASKRGKVLQPTLTWDTNVRNAVKQGAEVVKVPLREDMAIDLPAMTAALDDSIAVVQVTNPNNPTGITLPAADVRAFCRRASQTATVLVDEAYVDLTDDPENNTMVDLVRAGHNVAVARTFSKIHGLAGLRIGYIIAPEAVTAEIDRYGLGDNPMTQPSLAAAIATYDDAQFLTYSKARIVEAREMVLEAVQRVELEALPAETNFVYVNLGDINADLFRDRMAARNILIRGIYEPYTHWSRVSMGRIEDVQRYVDALPRVLDELSA
jgi:histidinol-phosphate aminotransferase